MCVGRRCEISHCILFLMNIYSEPAGLGIELHARPASRTRQFLHADPNGGWRPGTGCRRTMERTSWGSLQSQLAGKQVSRRAGKPGTGGGQPTMPGGKRLRPAKEQDVLLHMDMTWTCSPKSYYVAAMYYLLQKADIL